MSLIYISICLFFFALFRILSYTINNLKCNHSKMYLTLWHVWAFVIVATAATISVVASLLFGAKAEPLIFVMRNFPNL